MCCRCHALTQSHRQTKAQQWTAIAAILYNTHRYYKQFLGLMQKAITDGLAELEKQLEVTDPVSQRVCVLLGQCSVHTCMLDRCEFCIQLKAVTNPISN